MILARVVGNVVATQKNHRYENARVMLCQQITPEGEDTSYSVLALDSVDAGVGDTVLIVQEGWSASTAATGKGHPVRAAPQPSLLTAHRHENQRALGALGRGGERFRQLEHGDGPGGIVVGAVADGVGAARRARLPAARRADVVHVRGEHDVLALQGGIAALEDADDVGGGGALDDPLFQDDVQRDAGQGPRRERTGANKPAKVTKRRHGGRLARPGKRRRLRLAAVGAAKHPDEIASAVRHGDNDGRAIDDLDLARRGGAAGSS